MKKTALWAQSLVLLVFVGLFFVLHLALPDRDFSQQENRELQMAPSFSFSALFDGKFTRNFEDYVTDQFPFRDGWITAKARAELAVGKDENNGVYLCEGETLLETYTAPDKADLCFSLDAINDLAENVGVPVYFALIPSAGEIRSDLLPAGAPNDSQKAVIDFAYSYVNAIPVDIYGALADHKDEALYYRTDHHWTTLGAYYGYQALAEAMGFEAAELSQLETTTVTNEFYGTAWSSSGFSWVQPDSIEARVRDSGALTITNFPKGEPEPGVLYDEGALSGKDKYKYFYGGNTPRLTIETGKTDAPSLLILRDSYMDSLSPYLTEHFGEIHILDLRYYRQSVRQYAQEHAIDQVLVCYNVKNFSEDTNIFLAGL